MMASTLSLILACHSWPLTWWTSDHQCLGADDLKLLTERALKEREFSNLANQISYGQTLLFFFSQFWTDFLWKLIWIQGANETSESVPYSL
jgi:hypothetical protein